MKKRFLVLCLFVLSCLTACQATPEQVKNRADNYQKNNEKSDVKINYVDLKMLKSQADGDWKVNTDNLILPDKLNLNSIESIYTLSLKYQENKRKNANLAASLFDVRVSNWKTSETDIHEISSDYEENGEYLSVEDNGFVARYNKLFNKQLEEETWGKVQQVIDMRSSDVTSESCRLSGRDTRLSTQTKKAEQWLNTRWKKWEPDFDYKIQKAVIRKKNKENQLTLQSAYLVSGMPLSSMDYSSFFNQDDNQYGHSFAQISIDMNRDGEIGSLTNGTAGLAVIGKKEEKKFVDIPSAIHIVEHKLSAFKKIKVAAIYANYWLQIDFSDKEISRLKEHKMSSQEPGKGLSGVPVYTFLIKKNLSNESEIDDDNIYGFVLVNMLTGEVNESLDNIQYEGENK